MAGILVFLMFATCNSFKSKIGHHIVSPRFQSGIPRYCILDDQNKTESAFLEALKKTTPYNLWDFLAFDRVRGAPGLPGLSGESPCPILKQLSSTDWTCQKARYSNFNMTLPIKEVESVWITPQINKQGRLYPIGAASNRGLYEIGEPWGGSETKDAPSKHHGPRGKMKGAPYKGFAYDGFGCEKGCACVEQSLCDLPSVLKMFRDYKSHGATLIVSLWDKPWTSEYPEDVIKAETDTFDFVFHEANDVKRESIFTYPKGLDVYYILGREREFYNAMVSATLHSKQGVLAAWGARREWDEEWMIKAHGEESIELHEFVESVDYIEEREIQSTQYFQELAKYRFLVAPRGNGIQSPKFIEAVLMMTIPITSNYSCWVDLKSAGFPIVVVDNWNEITPENLERWWEELSPQMGKKRWIATMEGVESLLFGKCYRD